MESLSLKIRARYYLPLEGPTRLSPALEEHLSRLDRSIGPRRVLAYLQETTRGTDATLKGRLAELFFVAAWNDGDHSRNGVRSVRLATEFEDNEESTDAMMTLTNGLEIRFQIKTNYTMGIGGILFSMYARRKIVIMNVSLTHTFKQIRYDTIAALLRYHSILIEPAARPIASP